MKIEYVLWDWNGTLLDDVEIALVANNEIFPRFGLKPMGDLEAYRNVFDFPIRDYYEKVGVTSELFDEVAKAWSDVYMEKSKAAPLQIEAENTLNLFKQKGLTQVILSASKQEHLHTQVHYYAIAHYFKAMLGLSNIYAASKVDIAKAFLQKEGLNPQKAVFIGDTLHDAQVAKAIGCNCVLVARGHQPAGRLAQAGVPVYQSLLEARKQILACNE